MKYFSIMLDDKNHTVIYMVRANSQEDAMEKFSISETGARKLADGKWIIYANSKKFDEHYNSLNELVEGHWKKTCQRFEIHEIDFDPAKDVQGVFCSMEKNIE
jgi:hypothetical protein